MGGSFNPYHKWLGIPPKDQPPTHYRLLAIELLESDREVIDAAANRLMTYLKALATGEDAEHSQKLLNEVAAARRCLLDPKQKAAYDAQLQDSAGPGGELPIGAPLDTSPVPLDFLKKKPAVEKASPMPGPLDNSPVPLDFLEKKPAAASPAPMPGPVDTSPVPLDFLKESAASASTPSAAAAATAKKRLPRRQADKAWHKRPEVWIAVGVICLFAVLGLIFFNLPSPQGGSSPPSPSHEQKKSGEKSAVKKNAVNEKRGD